MIIATTANAFADDVKSNSGIGMNAHLSKTGGSGHPVLSAAKHAAIGWRAISAGYSVVLRISLFFST